MPKLYSENFLFVAQWLWQFVFFLGGLTFMVSESHVLVYCGRLLGILLTGVLLNVVILRVHDRRRWAHDLGNVVNQMYFVAAFMGL